jgi:preprotein translocase subunit SecA
MVQRGLNYVIVDEVDSVLIDEARMPIEVMNETDQTPDTCYAVDRLVREIDSVYIELDEKKRRVQLTEEGIDYVEQLLIRDGLIKHGHLYDLDNVYLVHLVGQALHARYIYKRDKDYVIKDNEVVLVDELRGRMLVGRRLGEGLHEAIEAKEGLPLRKQGAVVAKTTYQNYFRLYEKLSGMTGTATMDVEEYRQIYNIQVLEIPTNLPMIRADLDDEVYRSEEDKLNAVVERIRKSHARGQPVLIGTTSVGKSEALAAILSRENIVHEVLNARHHEREAEIIASAGRLGAVTIATNMAGRGTDIQLGGNLEVRLAQEVAGLVDQDEAARKTAEIKAEIAAEREAVRQAGGLLILGTERFYCRRIDDQLIGRAGRQGDPGESVFMLSLDDDLIRVFGAGDMLKRRLKKVGFAPGEAMFHSWLTRAIRKAQEALEEMFIQARMEVLDYDDVSDTQRKLVYEMRREILSADSFEERLDEVRAQVVDELVERHMPRNAYAEQWDIAGLKTELLDMFNLVVPVEAWAAEEGIANEEMHQRIERAVTDLWSMRLASFSDEERWRLVRELSLMTLDECWRLHIAALDYLRFGINLRAIAQRVPLYEYRTEAFSFFEEMLLRHRDNLVRAVSRMMPIGAAEPAPPLPSHGTFVAQHVRRIGPCPCGSGKRFKDCHGRMGDALTSRPTAADQRRVPGRLFIPQMHEVGVTTNRVVFGSRAD